MKSIKRLTGNFLPRLFACTPRPVPPVVLMTKNLAGELHTALLTIATLSLGITIINNSQDHQNCGLLFDRDRVQLDRDIFW